MTIADVRNAKRPAKKAAKSSAVAKQSVTTAKSSAAAKPSAIAKPNQDLRAWIEALRAADEVQEVFGAEREAEIGGIVDLYMRKMGNKALLFDDVPGYARGHRILANILTSVRRINLTLGLPVDGSAVELVAYWRKYMKEARSIAPRVVKSGPLMENIHTGKDIDITKIPTPRWHENDVFY
jgi:4-hydroxy-3-polyprenylbenzoate decarboxylase